MKKIYFLTFFLIATLMGCTQKPVNQVENTEKDAYVSMQTNKGTIVLRLYGDTPLHRNNFLKLVGDGTLDSLLFHRVIAQFMIQGGDPNSKGAPKGKMLGDGSLGYHVTAEFRNHLFHKRGALCAAREGDMVNPLKESSSSQFYIVQGRVWSEAELTMMEQRYGKHFSSEQRQAYTTVGGTPHLDGDYTVFGEVVEGMEVVDSIAAVKCDRFDRPLEDVVIEKVTVVDGDSYGGKAERK
ncbi:MAG: peptidylprolyl isomerase [Bacteroidales bacterium]|nr:peptidylprolyl isomerase [Bacteroidales bacterium]